MTTTGQIPEPRAMEGAVVAMATTMTTVRVRRTRRAVTKGTGKARVQKMGRGKGWGRQRRKRRGRGSERVIGKILLNKPQEEMITLVLLLCSCRRKCMRQTWTRRAN